MFIVNNCHTQFFINTTIMLLITVNFCFSNNVSFNKAGESYKNGLFSNGSYVIELSKEYNNIRDVILEKDIIFNSFIDSVF